MRLKGFLAFIIVFIMLITNCIPVLNTIVYATGDEKKIIFENYSSLNMDGETIVGINYQFQYGEEQKTVTLNLYNEDNSEAEYLTREDSGKIKVDAILNKDTVKGAYVTVTSEDGEIDFSRIKVNLLGEFLEVNEGKVQVPNQVRYFEEENGQNIEKWGDIDDWEVWIGDVTYQINNGALEFCLAEGDSVEGNVISYSNGYQVTVEVLDNEYDGEFTLNGNNNVELQNISRGTDVKFELTGVPEGFEETYDQEDETKLNNPTLQIGNAREWFYIVEDKYTYTRSIQYMDSNVIQIMLNDEENGGNQGGNNPQIELGALEFYLNEGDSVEGNVISYSNGYQVTVTVLDNEYDGEFTLNGNNNVELQNISAGTDVKFELTGVPEGFEETYDQEDETKLNNPTLQIGNAREWFYISNNKYTYTKNIQFNNGNIISVMLNNEENGGNQGGEENLDSVAYINLSVSGVELENPYGNSATEIRVSVNDFDGESSEIDPENVTNTYTTVDGEQRVASLTTIEPIAIPYNSNGDNQKVIIGIGAQWNTYLTDVTINDVSFENDLPKTKDELIEYYQGQTIKLYFEVDKTEDNIYDVEIEGRKQTGDEVIMGNFLWNYDPNSNACEDDKIPNAKLEFVKAEYNGETYDSVEEINEMGGVYHWQDAERKAVYTENDSAWGEATFPVGTELTVRLIPDEGYQLTTFALCGQPFEPGETPCVYTFEITGGNFHLEARFTREENSVITGSQKIQEGSIILSQNTFNNGTAKLEINDVNNLSNNSINGFKQEAEKGGYTVDNYIDLSLFNTIYKGGKKDQNGNFESWDTSVENLNGDAEITLKLNENMSDKYVAIIHETHDGNYEFIDTEYNEGNNTITFNTNSFSNYSIISKEKPKTVELKTTSYTYDGKEKKPGVVVKDAEGKEIASSNYTLTYTNNKNVGTGKVTVTFDGNHYKGSITKTFIINAKNISTVTVPTVGNKAYTGNQIKPTLTIKDGSTTLKNGADYTLSYSNNTNTGKATITITGKGNYKGTKKVTFRIIPAKVKNLKVKSQNQTTITLSWTKNGGNVTGYKVYRYDSKNKKYVYVGKTTNLTYAIKNLNAGTTYKLKVVAYKTIDSNDYGSAINEINASTKTKTPTVKSTSVGKQYITVRWAKVSGANGYEVQYATKADFSDGKIVTRNSSATAAQIKGLKSNKKYYVRVRTYRTVNGKKIYSSYSPKKYNIVK